MPSKNVADALYVFKQINAKMTRKRPEMKVNEEKLTLMELELKKLIETTSHYT
jgi:Fe-S cluster biosynthesis and repair protein YggX